MVRNPQKITIPPEELAEFCSRNHIRRLSFFGSVLTENFSPESDVNVLIEFEPGHTPGYGLIRIQDELSALLDGRRVDLVTPKFLNKRIREKIIAEAQVQYAQG